MISASISWVTGAVIGCGPPSLPQFARRRSVLARRFSLELKRWSTRSFLDAAVAGQEMGGEELTESRLFGENADHLGLVHPHQSAFDHCRGGCQTQRLADQASLAEEVARPQDRDDRLLAE